MEPSKVVVYSLLETDIGTCSCSTLAFSDEMMRTKKQEIALSQILDLKIFGEGGMPPHATSLERLPGSALDTFFVCLHLRSLTLRPCINASVFSKLY